MRKDKVVILRLTEKEKEEIQKKAKSANKSMSQYIIDTAINGVTVDYSYLIKLLVSINRIGNNINQAVKNMNTYFAFDDSDYGYFVREFKRLKELIEKNFNLR